MSGRFEGKGALVTGAGRGIGAAVARRLATEGATVAVVDFGADVADEVATAIREAGGRAHSYQCDVRDAGQAVGVVVGVGRDDARRARERSRRHSASIIVDALPLMSM